MPKLRFRVLTPFTPSSFRDERYLPFEGAGAIGENGPPSSSSATCHQTTRIQRIATSADPCAPSFLALDLRRDFATELSRFLSPVNAAAGNVFELGMASGLFPIRDAGKRPGHQEHYCLGEVQ